MYVFYFSTLAPCVPTNVLAQTVCPQTHANISWQASLGAVSYEVTAVSNGAPQAQCNSTETTCQLEDLVCGQTYSITATALDDQCNSETSAETELKTEPCPPTGLVASVDCASNSAVLAWDSTANAVSYRAQAVSSSGHTVSCDAGAALNCNLEDLECGQSYNFTVIASDGNCESAESEAITFYSAPCAVTSVINTVDCDSDSLTTSWTSADPSLNYTVKAESSDGSVELCETEQSTCVLSGLPCGQSYTVTVIPTSSTCTGQSSTPQVVNTGVGNVFFY
ncbi:hypothetical protein NL108_016242 [Boleophthalmus pectinirostris]|nr:hypothetical protein NL108_016242 [Boleophthalmus pectinirostris]